MLLIKSTQTQWPKMANVGFPDFKVCRPTGAGWPQGAGYQDVALGSRSGPFVSSGG